MRIDEIALRDFRSWEDQSLSFGEEVNIIWGPNGRGKTNLLEGVFLLSGLKSWRTAKKQELVRWERPQAQIRATVHARDREFHMVMTIPFSGKETTLVNNVRMGTKGRLSDYFRCVLFSPEDLHLVKGPPVQRRNLLDTALCQLRPRYAILLDQYAKLLQSKSRLLKAEERRGQALALLPEYNGQLARVGAALVRYRARFSGLLDEESRKVHSLISDGQEELRLCYRTVSSVTDPTGEEEQIAGQLIEHLTSHREAEERTGTCLSGVHRDDLEISINGRSARAYASQGQTRSAALALKFGERELFFRDNGEYPVLLLDDVLSELDQKRRSFICTHTMGGQSMITGCQRPEGFDRAHVIEI